MHIYIYIYIYIHVRRAGPRAPPIPRISLDSQESVKQMHRQKLLAFTPEIGRNPGTGRSD